MWRYQWTFQEPQKRRTAEKEQARGPLTTSTQVLMCVCMKLEKKTNCISPEMAVCMNVCIYICCISLRFEKKCEMNLCISHLESLCDRDYLPDPPDLKLW